MSTAIDNLYKNLKQLDKSDPVTSAIYRERAQNILANPKIALRVRMTIADLLMVANQELTLNTVGGDDSY